MATTIQQMTADDLLKMPDDGFRYELVRGELRKSPFSDARHGLIAMSIGSSLGNRVSRDRLGIVYATGTGFQLASDTVRAPDVSFVRQDRIDEVGNPTGYFPGPPDLAIEVISPSDTYGEVEEKVLDWLNFGTQMVVVINPRTRTVTVHRPTRESVTLTDKDTLDGGEV